VEAFLFYDPHCPGIAAQAKPGSSRCGDKVGICRMRAHLVNIAVDSDGGLPGSSTIRGTRNTSHVNVGEQDIPVRVGGDRADAERRPNPLPVHNGRAGKPCISPRDAVETIDRFENARIENAASARLQNEHAGIVGANVDDVLNRHAARKLKLAGSDGCPFAAWRTSAQRMLTDNGERAAASIGCEPSDGMVRNLLRVLIAGDCEQSIVPRCHKYCRFRLLR